VPGDGEQHVERLEMAQLRMEAVIEASRKWRIHDASLLRWRRKLKRAAQECGVALRERKQRAVREEREQASSFPRRVARAATLFGGGRRDYWNRPSALLPINCRLFCRSIVGDEHR
jgi:hypothetical protein